MKFHILTLFPEMIQSGLSESVIGRARENGSIVVETVNIRDFSLDKHRKVDDYPYGGGAGLLMQAQPVYDAWKSVREAAKKALRTVYMTPQGKPFCQSMAGELAKEEELIFLCGHYEGIDDRVLEEIVTDYVSIGDYVLTGGELAAMVMVDAIARLVPGVLHNEASAETESFHRYLLEYPQYSRPEIWHGKSVPEVLLRGDHKKTAEWRREKSLALTRERRPDLYERYLEQEALIAALAPGKRRNIHMMESLARGRGEILFTQGENALLYDGSCDLYLCSAREEACGRKMPALMNGAERALVSQKELADMLREVLGFGRVREYKQACYTRKTPLRVRYKDIRPLSGEERLHAEKLQEGSGDCPEADMKTDALYGAYENDRLIGYGGWYADGSLGCLFVEKEFRGKGIGASLEAFSINRQLEAGFVPYGRVPAGNTAAMKLQERLGLYVSAESVWLLDAPDTARNK